MALAVDIKNSCLQSTVRNRRLSGNSARRENGEKLRIRISASEENIRARATEQLPRSAVYSRTAFWLLCKGVVAIHMSKADLGQPSGYSVTG